MFPRAAVAVVALLLATRGPAVAQTGLPQLQLEFADGRVEAATTVVERGFAAVPLSVFETLGWSIGETAGVVAVAGPDGVILTLRFGSPFFHWGESVLQLTDPPYREDGEPRVPLQLLVDFLPSRLPDLYDFDSPSLTLRAADPGDWAVGDASRAALREPDVEEPPQREAEPPVREVPAPDTAVDVPATPDPVYEGPRVVVIDPGHGGGDPGALGHGGVREKDIALGIARGMAELLRREPGIEVYLTRDDDTFVPIWDRGERATDWKGERAGVFVSLHANSLPSRRSARGFETYFLSEARTEHERRVAAIENAPLQAGGQDIDPEAEPDLGFILRELRTLDHQHWSALLAEMVQQELGNFHPGPNRGVKQGVLAVLTNALMPSVLVEVGFISNEEEAPLLGQATFQTEAARSIARAVVRFFERYPPGAGGAGEGA